MTAFTDIAEGEPSLWRDRIRRVGQLGFALALLVAILPYGAVTPVWTTFAFLMTVAAAGIASLVPPVERRTRMAYGLSLALAVVMTAYLLGQSWSFSGNPFTNAGATLASSLVDGLPSAVSVDRFATLQAIIPLTMPFLLYGAALALFPDDDAAFRLVALVAGIGTAFALFGLVQIAFLPNSLLFTEKLAYLDSLTSIFVNRNTAGTLLGVASLACCLVLMRMVRQAARPLALLSLLTSSRFSRGRRLRAVVLTLSVFICLLALLLTRSRGAILATAAAFVTILPALFYEASDSYLGRDRKNKTKRRRRLLAGIGLSVLIVGVVLLVFGGQFLLRFETRGLDASRFCLYSATFRAFQDNWLFGTGFGTFESVFPSYRPLGCGSPYEHFERAHNVFLEGLLGMGIVFVPFALIVYGHIAFVLVRGLRSRRRLRFVPIIGIGAVLLVTLHSLVDFSVQIPGMAAYLAAFLAAVSTISLGRPNGARKSSSIGAARARTDRSHLP